MTNSHTRTRCWAVVPAAGSGSRMQAALAKQYLKIDDQSIVEITLNKLLRLNFISGIVVCIARDDEHFAGLAVAKHPRIFTAEGGSERADSVLKGLQYLKALPEASDSDWVMVHDAARPCVSLTAIERLYNFCRTAGHGAILAAPVADTLKRADQQGRLAQTVSRENLWHAHTPQCFPLGQLSAALVQSLQNSLVVTDEASALEQVGAQIGLVEDTRDNIKITRPEDLALASFILGQKALDW
ncbi:MAG TPA: 2-C-methyl-D-erythritol 4-phosphate cytidylyltransferase [Marinagarivorans sp.]